MDQGGIPHDGNVKQHPEVYLEIAMNGFYIPVVDTNGKVLFSPNDYDLLRSKMSGLSYYEASEYKFSDNFILQIINSFL